MQRRSIEGLEKVHIESGEGAERVQGGSLKGSAGFNEGPKVSIGSREDADSVQSRCREGQERVLRESGEGPRGTREVLESLQRFRDGPERH